MFSNFEISSKKKKNYMYCENINISHLPWSEFRHSTPIFTRNLKTVIADLINLIDVHGSLEMFNMHSSGCSDNI